MRRQTSVASLLYSHIHPDDTTNSSSFSVFLANCLIPEVRVEVATYYGSLDSIEARYPGLDYCHPSHRMRLGRFPNHARLFRAIDDLGITKQEVADLARWEGTLWARQRFERDEQCKVRDTTGSGIGPWTDWRRAAKKQNEKGIRVRVERAVKITQDPLLDTSLYEGMDMPRVEDFIEDHSRMEEDTAEDEGQDNHGDHEQAADLDFALSQGTRTSNHNLERRILAAFAARQQGSTLDIHPDLEAYLKELVENGHLLAASRPADGPLPDTNSATTLPSANSTLGQPAA